MNSVAATLVIVVELRVLVSLTAVSRLVLGALHLGLILHHHLLLLLLVVSEVLQALSVGRSNEVGLHIVNPALGVHQVLLVFALNLDHPHNDAINHVNGLLLLVVPQLLVNGVVGVVLVLSEVGLPPIHINIV